jgi:hypothetical protein
MRWKVEVKKIYKILEKESKVNSKLKLKKDKGIKRVRERERE